MKYCMKIIAILFLISINTSYAMDGSETARCVNWKDLCFLLHDYERYGLTVKEETESDADLEKMYRQLLDDETHKTWGEFRWAIRINTGHAIDIFSNGLHMHYVKAPGFTHGALGALIILQYNHHIPYALGMVTVINDAESRHSDAQFIISSASSSSAMSPSAPTADSSSSTSATATVTTAAESSASSSSVAASGCCQTRMCVETKAQ